MNRRTVNAGALVLVLALGVLGLTGCGTAADPKTETSSALSGAFNVEGSDTMVNLANSWAEAFMTENPEVNIAVKGGGSGNGIAALINGTADFANASREIKDEEAEQAKAKGLVPVATAVARDGIAVVVNPANPVSDLTIDQLGGIYRGEIVNWKDVGGPDKAIVLLSRDSSSGTYEYFKEEVVGKDKNFARAAKLLASTQAIVEETTGNDAAIGYIGVGYATPDLKVIAVEGVPASVETVLDGTYPISRELYMYSDGAPADVAKAYIDWILSPAGQAIVEDEGYVPMGS